MEQLNCFNFTSQDALFSHVGSYNKLNSGIAPLFNQIYMRRQENDSTYLKTFITDNCHLWVEVGGRLSLTAFKLYAFIYDYYS